MPYEIVLPPDTAHEITEFVDNRWVGEATQLAAIDIIEQMMEVLSYNPLLGAVPRGTPFETRRIHRFTVAAGDETATVELIYKLTESHRIVSVGFAWNGLSFNVVLAS